MTRRLAFVAAALLGCALSAPLATAQVQPEATEQPEVTEQPEATEQPETAQPLAAPAGLAVTVPDNSDGLHLLATWKKSPDSRVTAAILLRAPGTPATAPTYAAGKWSPPWVFVKRLPVDTAFKDELSDRSPRTYALVNVAERTTPEGLTVIDQVSPAAISDAIAPRPAWFDTSRWFYGLIVLAMGLALAYFIHRARKSGSDMFIRRIPGVDAIEEAVGRSTEMGRPVLYVTGVDQIVNIQTIASLLILGHVAEMTAEYDTDLKVTNAYPLTMVVAEEIVRQGYADAGRIDAHKPENVMFISSEQFAFAAGVNGLILRDRPATNIYLGRFFAESLILAETGYITGAIQIAGTAEISQLPFFIAACDYTIIGEELYAVSAYLSREPKLLATIKTTDLIKVGVIALVVVGVTLSTLGIVNLGPLLIP